MNLGWATALRRRRLQRAALRYARNGWDVVPGAYLTENGYTCGRSCPTKGVHAVPHEVDISATREEPKIARWWSEEPYNVILPTGRVFDVIDVPGNVGETALNELRSKDEAMAPIAVSATGRWDFFVARGEPLRPELDERLDVVFHGEASWVLAPPAKLAQGNARWVVPPSSLNWTLPSPHVVQQVLLDAIVQTTAKDRVSYVSRQMQPSF